MKIKITLHCPDCRCTKINRNAKKSYGKQNYLRKKCGQQFIGGHALKYKACYSSPTQKIALPLVRWIGIRDIAEIERISIKKLCRYCYAPGI
jgi:transposase-like protein